MDVKFDFMRGVLGLEGAKALSKAAARSGALENALLPRTIVSWLELASMNGSYEGGLPGVDNSYIQFQKSEEDFTGSIGIEGEVYTFHDSSIYHVASAVAVALGLDHEPMDSRIRPNDLARLGKTIDTLSKAHILIDSLRKAEAPGPAHSPTQQLGPTIPVAPTLQTTNKKPKKSLIPTVPKIPSVTVTKSESEVLCSACGRAQFIAGRFTGCLCQVSLSKSVKTKPHSTGYVMEFGEDWNNESFGVLMKAMGKT